MQEKTCTKCGVSKTLDEFHNNHKGKFGKESKCKECRSICNKDNKEYRREYMKSYRESEKGKEYYTQNKESINAKSRQYHKDNKSQILRQKKIYERIQLSTNPNYRISKNLRCRTRQALNGISKSKSTMELLGCNIDEFKTHLQETAINNGYLDFNINNYSSDEYHIDHIIPCASFDLTDSEQQKRCFHYSNQQILTSYENLSKSDKVGN